MNEEPKKAIEQDIGSASSPRIDSPLDLLRKSISEISLPTVSPVISRAPALHTKSSVSIDEKIRKQKIENDNKEKDQRLKGRTLTALFIFLGTETFIIFLLAFAQGFKLWKFGLDEWSFRLVIAGTLGQITAMLSVAVRHLFPKK